jgi:transcriptional regulator with XRE-family HTH domain
MHHPLKEARLSHDPPLRLIDVAERAGVSVSLVSMLETGRVCSDEKMAAIAHAVGASYGSFWEPK